VLICLAAIGAEITFFVMKGTGSFPWPDKAVEATTRAANTGNTEMIADVLFSEYLLPFEIASVLLLVAVVGSVFMAKKEKV
jgi:NADH-quinone oxidoreductase subunit J